MPKKGYIISLILIKKEWITMAKNKTYYQRAERILCRMIQKNKIKKNLRSHYKTVKSLCQACIEGQKQGFLPPPNTNV